MVRQREITESQWAELRACADKNMSLTSAARHMGVGHGWLQKSAKRLGREEELQRIFPERFHVLNQFTLTPERKERLKALTAAGETRRAIAERFGCCQHTLTKAIAAEGLKPEIDKLIAARRGPRKSEPKATDLVPRDSDPAVQWLTRAWRKAA